MADTSLIFNIVARDQASQKFDKIKAKAALLGVAVAAMAAKFGGDAIRNASDLNETMTKTQVIFGKATPEITKFADTASTKLGQSKKSALDAAASFAIMGKGAGLSGKNLTGFSTDLTKLSSDLASFHNTSPEEAITAISAALRGESEPIRKYGVLLNEAAIKAEAMSLGLVKATKDTDKIKVYQLKSITAQRNYNAAVKEHGKNSDEALKAQASLMSTQALLAKATTGTIAPLTQQQKVLASQSLIMKQTKDAQGDFARTSDGLANRQRILKARYEDISATIGMKLLPAVTGLAGGVLSLIGFTQKHTTGVKRAAIAVGVLAVGIGALVAAYKIQAAMIAINTEGTVAYALASHVAAAKLKATAAAQWLLNAAMDANPIGLVVIAIALLVAGLIIAYKKSETFRNIVNGAFGAVKDAGQAMWQGLKAAFGFIVDKFLWVAGMIVNSAAKAFGWVPGIGPKLKKAAAEFETFRDSVNASLSGIQRTIPVSFVAIGAGGAPNSKFAGKPLPIDGRVAGQGKKDSDNIQRIADAAARRNRADPLTAGFGAT